MLLTLFRFLSPSLLIILCLAQNVAQAQAKVMNSGEAIGQLIFLSMEDVLEESDKYESLTPLSIPVFAELPMELSVVAGVITIAQQNLLSHVQIKSRARGAPNLDISQLEGGLKSDLLGAFSDGDWIHMNLGRDGTIRLEPSTEQAAEDFYERKTTQRIDLQSDLQSKRIFRTEELTWRDFDKVGSKAANYAELAQALNTPDRQVVPLGYAIPFYYYQQFLDDNPEIKKMVTRLQRDPLMNRLSLVGYRRQKLDQLRDRIEDEDNLIRPELIEELIETFEEKRNSQGLPRRLKLRSSTNAEDLPNFNGAGLYSSESYKPAKDGKEKSYDEKVESLTKALREVWASVWNLRAYEERAFFQIPHEQVMMGIQVNPSFRNEDVDGVVITKNVANSKEFKGQAVYIEAQRGDDHSVANPLPGVKPEKILVLVDESHPLNTSAYEIHVLQKSNIGDDKKTILETENPHPIMSDQEIRDLAYQALKAERHFHPLLGSNDPDFALDLEFKVDASITGLRQVYLKQARPYID